MVYEHILVEFKTMSGIPIIDKKFYLAVDSPLFSGTNITVLSRSYFGKYSKYEREMLKP